MKNKKLLYGILAVCILAVIAVALLAFNPLAGFAVSVSTDKAGYAKGESVNITLFNGSPEAIFYHSYSVQQQKGSLWEPISTRILCPCNALCNMAELLTPLETEKTKQFTWDQKIRSCDKSVEKTEDAPQGRYRIEIKYELCGSEITDKSMPVASFNCKSTGSQTVYSKEFTIS